MTEPARPLDLSKRPDHFECDRLHMKLSEGACGLYYKRAKVGTSCYGCPTGKANEGKAIVPEDRLWSTGARAKAIKSVAAHRHERARALKSTPASGRVRSSSSSAEARPRHERGRAKALPARFGVWEVIGEAGTDKHGQLLIEVRCKCGVVRTKMLRVMERDDRRPSGCRSCAAMRRKGSQLVEHNGRSKTTLQDRLARGWSMEAALDPTLARPGPKTSKSKTIRARYCATCGVEVGKYLTRCKPCAAERTRQRDRDRKRRLREERGQPVGVCKECGGSRERGFERCKPCRTERNRRLNLEQVRRYMQKKRGQR